SGTRLDPHGQGRVHLANGTAYGQPFTRATADIQFVNGEAEINNIQAFQDSATVTGSAGYNLATKNFHFTLAGKDFDLAQFPELQTSRFMMDGRMDFTAQGSGTEEQPGINAQLRLRDLAFDKERAGDFVLNLVSQGPDLRVTGNSRFTTSELTIEGMVRPHNDWPADLTLHFNHLDIDSLIRAYFRGKVTGHSAVAGDIKIKGPLRRPRDLEVTANLNEFLVDVQKIKVINDGPIRFAMKNENFDLQQLHLVGDLTDFSAHGTAQLSGQRSLDMRADGHVNLKLIESFNPDFTSSGTVTAGLSVAGTVSDPLLQGRVEISDGAVSYIDLPSGLSNMNGTLIFNQDRLQIETLTARTGGGSLNLGGSVTYFRGTPNFDLSIQGQEIRLRYPPGVSSTANTDLRLVGNSSSAALSGDITITKLAVTPGFDFASYLERSKQSVAVPTGNSLLNRLKLDVHITTTEDLQMQTALAKLTGDADLRATGTAAKPVLLGRVDILEGEVNFNGAKYRLERGDVTFNNPVRIDPILDLQATTRVSDYDITVNLTGEADKLRINWRSEPPLPETDIVGLLAMGRTPEQSVALQGTASAYSPEASNIILSQALTAAQTNRAQRLFGVARIKIDPQGLGTETSINRGPQVTIEQQVYNNLTLTYSTNVSQTSQQIIQVEYNITRNLSIVALRDYNGVVSFDVKLRRRKK
ncbi:MAG TPA: translocation/assembly module TamB domain-containing protein, partial [Terriglobales bacterium]|nr:translocation/assembly module TamB domain-containing protein [Terriglobales bacterium]